MCEVTGCYGRNILNVGSLPINNSNTLSQNSWLVEQKPQENIKLDFHLNHLAERMNSSYSNTTIYTLKLKLTFTFENYIHEIYTNLMQKYAYEIKIKALLKDDKGIHVNFTRDFIQTRTSNILKFETQELLLSKEHKILHLCFDIRRLRLDKQRNDEKLFCHETHCELLYKNPKGRCISLHIGDQIFSVHEEVLSKSAVFAAMFNNDMKENSTNSLVIKGIDAEIIEEMLRFLYTNQISNHIIRPLDLYAATNKYQIDDLSDYCLEYLIFNLRFENAASLYILVDFYNISCLKTCLRSFFQKYNNHMIQEDTFKDYLNEHININSIVDILLFCIKFHLEMQEDKKAAFDFVKKIHLKFSQTQEC
ncbi:hypothetical protein TKK_0001419 [Trichogramma kaykai]|uniref:BTB domain-containing protein n=1 Tax=Trichogramma kaykai TaxID=54128 RepID=A0ABD2X2J6_9HYME